MTTRFKDLSNGDTFDFIDEQNPTYNSFYRRCKKTGTRQYMTLDSSVIYGIGTIECKVFHVERKGK